MRDVNFMAWARSGISYVDFPFVSEPWLHHPIDMVGVQATLIAGEAQAMHICNSYRANIMGMAAGKPINTLDWEAHPDAVLPFPSIETAPPGAHFDIHIEFLAYPYLLIYTVVYADAEVS